MDIYTAEIQVNKLLNYVKDLSDSKPRMYQKSKDRLKELANTCNQVVLVIAEILQDEALLNDQQDEFGGSGTSDFNSMLNSMEDQILELRQFLNAPKPEVLKERNNSKKLAINRYKYCLSSLSSSNILVEEAEDCSKLIWNWFETRFLSYSDTFKYNMKRIPRWIRDIVILYGYHLECGTLAEYEKQFEEWISSITVGNNNYAVPYEVYQFDTEPTAEFATLSSVVIWDILLDYGLRDLCIDSSSELYPSEDCVYNLVGSLDSSVMDPYSNYMYDHSILDKCNLTLKAGDNR